MRKILFVCAMEKESKRIVEKLELDEKCDNVFSNGDITLLKTGIGKQRTAISLVQYLENNERPDLMINVGYAGSTDIPIGKWVCVKNSYNYEWYIPGEEQYSFIDMKNEELVGLDKNTIECVDCYSAECFVEKTELKGHIAFDMELHSVVTIGEMYNIKVMSLKKISDNLSLDKYYDTTTNSSEVFELDSCLDLLKDIL